MIAVTTDGHEVKISAHVKLPHQLPQLEVCEAGEIGLLEMASFAGGCLGPELEEHLLNILLEAGHMTGGKPVTVLLADPDHDCRNGVKSSLGRRGVRSYLAQPENYQSQLRALLRAVPHGSYGLAVPMVGHVHEMVQFKQVIHNVNAELEAEGLLSCPPRMGIMVEVPSVIPTINTLIYESSFFIVGDNFLKYLMADDRLSGEEGDFLPFYHQAFLLHVQVLTNSLRRRKAGVRICAPIVRDPAAIPILLGLGFDEIVAPPGMIPEINRIIRSINYRNALLVTSKTTSFWDPAEAREYAMERLLKLTH